MKRIFTILILLTFFTSGFAQTKVIVMSDIGGSDPDGNDLTYEWIHYKEPGTYKGTLDILKSEPVQTIMIPNDAKGKTIHIVLKVTDNGTPSLTSYRRIVLECR